MVDLRAKPFYLNDQQIEWVEDTIAGMTLDEKLGQLFVILKTRPGVDEKQIEAVLDKYHQGGLRWQPPRSVEPAEARRTPITWDWWRDGRPPPLAATGCLTRCATYI